MFEAFTWSLSVGFGFGLGWKFAEGLSAFTFKLMNFWPVAGPGR